jgi:flagellar biosynthesis protein FliQ
MVTFSEFHTNLRNIGLFITLAFGTMGYSNNFKNKTYKKSLIITSLVFLIISSLLTSHLMQYQDETQDKKLSIIPKIIFGLIILLFFLGIVLLIK